MKFFKKLSSNNNNSGKKLLFLKNNKKDKDEKQKIQVDEKLESESLLDLHLPNDYSSSFDLPHFDRQDKHADSNTISNSSTNSSYVPANIDEEGRASTAVITAATTVEDGINDIPHQAHDAVDLKSEKINVSLDLEIQQNVEGEENKPLEIQKDEHADNLQLDANENTETDTTEDCNSHGEIVKEKENICLDQSTEEIKENIATIKPLVQHPEQTNEDSAAQKDQQEEVALISDLVENNPPEIVEVEISHSTPQNKQGTEQLSHESSSATNDGASMQEEYKEANVTRMNEKNTSINTEVPLTVIKKKDVDKRKSMQSFIPRKQFPQTTKEEEDKRPEVKDKKRNSSLPVLSSPANKLIITTTLVVDANNSNDTYYAPASNSSPSSTTSTSTTATNTSDNSSASAKKKSRTQQQYSKIPIASNFTSLKACSTQPSANHHMSRLPKKINNI